MRRRPRKVIGAADTCGRREVRGGARAGEGGEGEKGVVWAPEITSVSYGWQLRHSLAQCHSKGRPSRWHMFSRFYALAFPGPVGRVLFSLGLRGLRVSPVPRKGHAKHGPSIPVLLAAQKHFPSLLRGTGPPKQGDSPVPLARVSTGGLALGPPLQRGPGNASRYIGEGEGG